MEFIEAEIIGKIVHSEKSQVSPLTIKSGSRPNHRFREEPDEYFMGQIELINFAELKPGESCLGKIKVVATESLRKYFRVNNTWEITSASKHVGYFKIHEIQMP